MTAIKHRIGKGKIGFWLEEEDLDLLQLLLDFEYLSLYQIKYFCERLYGTRPDSIERKFRRWRQGKVVLSEEYTKRPAPKVYYRIGPEGLAILEKNGRINKGKRNVLDALSKRRNFDHFFAIRDVALLSIISLRKSKKDITSLSTFKAVYEDNEGDSTIVVPDWVLSNEYGNLNIELDTGSESLTKINDKITRYIKHATLRSDEINHVLLVILDENDPSLKYSAYMNKDRSGRIANLKDAIINMNAHIYPNLHFYVVSMSRAGEVAYHILTGDYPYSTAKKSDERLKATSALALNDTFKYVIEPLNSDDFYLAEVKESLYADGHYLFKDKENSTSETVLIKIMEEGSVTCLDTITYLNLLKSENRFKRKVDKILAIYHYKEQLYTDVLGKVLPYVDFTSIENLYDEIDQIPIVYRTVNTARKEEVVLYEG